MTDQPLSSPAQQPVPHPSTSAALTRPLPPLHLATLHHPGDGASACDEALARLSTFAAMQGLWRPTLEESDFGFFILSPQQAGLPNTVCGLTIPPDKNPAGILSRHDIPAGPTIEHRVAGPWAQIEHAATRLLASLPSLGKAPSGPWYCLFLTNPRSTAPEDWEALVRIPVTE